MNNLCVILLCLLLCLAGCGKTEDVPLLTPLETEQAYAAAFVEEPAPEADPLTLYQQAGWVLRVEEEPEWLYIDTPGGETWDPQLRYTMQDALYPTKDALYLQNGNALYLVTGKDTRPVDRQTRWITAAVRDDRLLAVGYDRDPGEYAFSLYSVSGQQDACLGKLAVEGKVRFLSSQFLMTDRAIYQLEGDTLTLLSDLVSLGIDAGAVTGLCDSADGPRLLTEGGYWQIFPAPEEVKKEEITVYALDDHQGLLAGLVSQFNAQSKTTTAALESFLEEEDLSFQLLTGQIPDLLLGVDASSMGYFQTAQRQGMLMPLTEPVAKALAEGSYFTNILDLYREDGEIYCVPLNFMLRMFRFPLSTLGDRTKIETLEELDAVIQASGVDSELCYKATGQIQLSMMNHLTGDSLPRWVDLEARTCSFDDPSFGEILQYSKRYKKEGEISPDVDVPPVFSLAWITTTEETGDQSELLENYREIPPFLSPCDGAAVDAECIMAMPRQETPPKGALELVDFLLSQQAQEYLVLHSFTAKLPILRTALSENPKADPAYRQHVLDLIAHADHYLAYNRAISDIIYEESSAYFADQRSLEDTQAMIQNRVSLYLSELK